MALFLMRTCSTVHVLMANSRQYSFCTSAQKSAPRHLGWGKWFGHRERIQDPTKVDLSRLGGGGGSPNTDPILGSIGSLRIFEYLADQ